MPLYLASSEAKMNKAVPAGVFSSPIPKEKVCVYGENASMYVSKFPPTYHTRPHMHASEQLNYMLDGEMWIFIKQKGFRLTKGDFLRVPKNTAHWAWNKSDHPAVLLETHSPGMQADKTNKDIAIPLFDEGEEIVTSGSPTNMQAKDFPEELVAEAESKAV